MEKGDLAQLIILSPEVRAIETMDEAQKLSWAKLQIDMAATRIVRSFDWDFALHVEDKSIVANVSDYVFKGATGIKCGHIKSIRIGESGGGDTAFKLLRKYTAVSVDSYLENHSVTIPAMWYLIIRKENYPQVRIINTPDSTYDGYVLRYRYWIAGLDYNNLDSDIFGEVIELYVRMKFNPVLLPLFKESIGFAISKYQPDGGQPNPAQLDSVVRRLNAERFGIPGYY